MKKLPADPFVPGGIAAFAERLRRGEITAEAAASAYVERIELLEPRLQAFEHVAGAPERVRPRKFGAAVPVGRNSYSRSCHEGRMAPVPEVIRGPSVENPLTVACTKVNGKHVSCFAGRRTDCP